MMRLDHLAVSGETLAAATDYVETQLGVPTGPGGVHVHFGTHNRLVGMGDDFYLEAIATNPGAAPLAYPRWFDLDRFCGGPRLTNWIIACDDLDAALADLGPDFGTPVSLERGDLRWKMAVPAPGILPFDGVAPALIEWLGVVHPAPMLPDTGARLDQLTVSHPLAAKLKDVLTPHLNDPRVEYVEGPAGLSAKVSTPNGQRQI